MTALQVGPLLIDRRALDAFCATWQIAELSVFGSVLRGDFRAESDIDVLVTFAPGERWGLHELLEMERELSRLFGRRVDLVERRAVEENPNWLTRQSILGSAQILRVA